MKHTSKVVEHKILSDGEIAVLVQCCDDPKTGTWLTVHNAHELDAPGLDSVVSKHLAECQAKHQKLMAALAHLKRLGS